MECTNLEQSETTEGLFVFSQHFQHFAAEKQYLQHFAATSVTGCFITIHILIPFRYFYGQNFIIVLSYSVSSPTYVRQSLRQVLEFTAVHFRISARFARLQGFRREDENCVLLDHYAVSSGNLPMFRDNLSVPSSRTPRLAVIPYR